MNRKGAERQIVVDEQTGGRETGRRDTGRYMNRQGVERR
jgi:hypothetical protein